MFLRRIKRLDIVIRPLYYLIKGGLDFDAKD